MNISPFTSKSYQKRGKIFKLSPRKEAQRPQSPFSGETDVSRAPAPTRRLGDPPDSLPAEGRWERRLAKVGRTRGSAEPPWRPPTTGCHVAILSDLTMAVSLARSHPLSGNRLIHAIKGELLLTFSIIPCQEEEVAPYTPQRSSASAIARIGRE